MPVVHGGAEVCRRWGGAGLCPRPLVHPSEAGGFGLVDCGGVEFAVGGAAVLPRALPDGRRRGVAPGVLFMLRLIMGGAYCWNGGYVDVEDVGVFMNVA